MLSEDFVDEVAVLDVVLSLVDVDECLVELDEDDEEDESDLEELSSSSSSSPPRRPSTAPAKRRPSVRPSRFDGG